MEREPAERAFEALLARPGPMVLRVCLAVLRDAHTAQDAFQATFMVLMQRAGTLWVDDSLGPWLHQVAHRTASCARAAAMRRERHERAAARRARAVESAAVPDRHEPERALLDEVARLPERYRWPIVLCYLEGLTHEQAARQLNWTVGAVRNRLTRGRDRLRTRLGRRHPAVVIGPMVAPWARTRIPEALSVSTAQRAVHVWTCGKKLAGVVPASVAALVEEVSRSMTILKLRSFASVSAVGFGCLGFAAFAQTTDEVGPIATPTLASRTVEEGAVARGPETSARDDRTAATSGVDEKLISQVAAARAEEEGMRTKVEVLEYELAKWVEIAKKFGGAGAASLGEAERQKSEEYGDIDENFDRVVAAVAKAKAELFEAEMTRDTLEQRLPERLRRTASIGGQERRLKELERKLDRIIATLDGSNSAEEK